MDKMDKKTYAIGILVVTAVILFVAQFLPVAQPSAIASDAVRDPSTEFQMVTARNPAGGESLYIMNRDGHIVVMQYDPAIRTLRSVSFNDAPKIFGATR